jgi:AhpC/TSA family
MSIKNTQQDATRSRRIDSVVLVLLVLAVLENLFLGVGVWRLSAVKTSPPPAPELAAVGPAIGSTLPALDAERFNGTREQVKFGADGRPTLIYVFSPSCGWCAKNLNNLKTLLSAVTTSHRVIALSLEAEVQEYIEKTALQAPVYIRPSDKMFGPYGLGPTPLTLVVAPDGTVIKSWVGAYSGDVKKEVESYFQVKLPGFARQLATATVQE